MRLSPRWHKVIRDLTGHKLRTLLVVVSIAVGIFAVGVVMGGRGVLIREFDTDYLTSAAPSAEFYTTDFDASLARAVETRNDVRAVDMRRQVGVRYTTESMPSSSTAGWRAADLWALPQFSSLKLQRLTRDEANSWPPGVGEVVLEKSALQIQKFSIGDTMTVETEDKTRVSLRIVGFAHDINAVPAQFSDTVVGYVSMPALAQLKQPERYNYLALSLDPGLSQQAAGRIAVDVRDRDLSAAGVQALRTVVPKPTAKALLLLTITTQRRNLRRHDGELGGRFGKIDIGFGVFDRFFSCSLGGIGFLVVEILAADGGVRQDGDAIGLHFKNAASDEDKLFRSIGQLNAHRTGLDARDQGRVARQDAELAAFTGKGDKTRFTREDGLFGADHIDMDGVHGNPALDFLGFFERFVDRANHVEGLFRQVITFAGHDHLEAANRFGQADVLAGRAGEHFSDVEGLRQETLDLAGAGHGLLVFRG